MATRNCEDGQNAAIALYDYLNILTGGNYSTPHSKLLFSSLNSTFQGIGEFFCAPRRFDSSSKYCKRFVASSKLRARGRNSNSILSKYFSIFFPNLGF